MIPFQHVLLFGEGLTTPPGGHTGKNSGPDLAMVLWWWWEGRFKSRTFFSQQEVQEVVGVGHAHFRLHLRASQGGVDVPGTLALLSLPQLGEPAAHLTAWGQHTRAHTNERVSNETNTRCQLSHDMKVSPRYLSTNQAALIGSDMFDQN